ncbi:TonB-dependent receptor domain-containing protein [Psychrobacter sp. I-STPA6b]|uniref:TonB-dependent receptor domain-containing protein n=1 Tax=Psychrobacter sp. I-STPA6b TaxID=2585718 RepID=UPI001D0CD199|nr:TonB-dependent receptor [Psychrobacter sp. I-STPA6b]
MISHPANTQTRFSRTPLNTILLSILATASLTMTANAQADVETSRTANVEVSTDNSPETVLPEVVITATRTPTLVSDTIAQTRIIDQEELQRYQGQTVLDVLKKQPGFSYYQYGGIGTKSSFYLRGYDSKQVLVLIDGIRYGAMDSGQPKLALLPADQIDRIEVLYGASGSSIYGSDAMGGVIQIFTKGRDASHTNASINAGIGSHNHYLYGVTAQWVSPSSTGGQTVASISASHNQTKGINATLPNASNPFSPYYPDKDGFKADNASLYLKHDINEQISLGLSGLYSKSTTDYDNGATVPNTYQQQEQGAANAFIQLNTNQLNTKLQYGESLDKINAVDKNSPNGNEFETKQKQANLVATYPLQVGQVIGGAEWLKQEVDSALYSTNNRTVKSVFAGYQISGEPYNLQANVRYDDNSQYKSETTYNLGAAYSITPSTRVGTSYATGFRAPNLNELYGGSGNPNLKPETSDNYEVFIENNSQLQTTRLTGYHSKVENLIDYDSNNSWKMGNIDKARIQGVTVTSDWNINNYLLGFSYDYQDAKNKSGNYKGDQIKFRPRHKGLVYAGYQGNDFDVRAEVQHISDRYALDGISTNRLGTKMDAYTLVNLSASYYLSPSLKLNTRIDNLTNEDYVTIDTYNTRYNTDGTNFMAALTYTWF